MKKSLNFLLTFRIGISRVVLLGMVMLVALLGFSQKTKKDLYSQKTKTLKAISETHKILKETRTQKKATIGQLNAIKKQINSKEELIVSINQEVVNLDEEIGELEMITTSMEHDLEALKSEYAKMIYAASKVSGKYDKLMFLFSANTFNQMLMRLKYMKFYAETRKDQLEQIGKVKDALLAEKQVIQLKKGKKQNLLGDNIKEKQSLEVLKEDKDKVARELAAKESELRKEINEKKKAVKKLENLIEDIIRKEIAASRKKAENQAKTKNSNSNSNKISLTPETKIISDNFAGNKGKMIWPLTSGFISQQFGSHPHSVLQHVTVNNLGVDIQTNAGQKCRAVFQGKVTAVANVPGMNQIVTIQHGEYMTVYAKLTGVIVKVGQEVVAKQEIGSVYTNHDDVTELQFQIWQNITNLDPESWLLRK